MHEESSQVFELPWGVKHTAEPRHIGVAIRPSDCGLAIDRIVRIERSTNFGPLQAVLPRPGEPVGSPWEGTIWTNDVDEPTRVCRGCSRPAPAWSHRPSPGLLDADSGALLRMENDGGRSPDQCSCGDWFEESASAVAHEHVGRRE
jgi:hypothetical protein